MIEIGKSLPNLTDPAATTGAAEILAFKTFPFLGPPVTMPGDGDGINPALRTPGRVTGFGLAIKIAGLRSLICVRIRPQYLCGLEYQGCAVGEVRRYDYAPGMAPRGHFVLPVQGLDLRNIGDGEAHRVERHPFTARLDRDAG